MKTNISGVTLPESTVARFNWLRDTIPLLDPDTKRVTPYPKDWIMAHSFMIQLVDLGILGMDGFQYQFREYAEDCWKRCHNGHYPQLLTGLPLDHHRNGDAHD